MAFSWTAPRTWVAGEKPPAATLNSHIRDNFEAINGYVLKTADESVTSSATLQDDNHLFFTIPQAGTYMFDIYLIGTSAANAAGDLTVGVTFPTGTCYLAAVGADSTLASGHLGPGEWGASAGYTSGSAFNGFGLSTSTVLVQVHGLLVASASGTLKLQWAQLASNANASTIKAGSHMTVRQVA